MLSSTLLPINTCFYFLFRAAICVTVSILPHLTQGPGCAESLIFPSSTLSPQPNTVLYQKVAKPPCLVVIAALTSFLPRREESIQSRVNVTPGSRPISPNLKGLKAKKLGLCGSVFVEGIRPPSILKLKRWVWSLWKHNPVSWSQSICCLKQ